MATDNTRTCDCAARIRAEHPDMQPSGGYDEVDELLGLLRVARGELDQYRSESLNQKARILELERLRYSHHPMPDNVHACQECGLPGATMHFPGGYLCSGGCKPPPVKGAIGAIAALFLVAVLGCCFAAMISGCAQTPRGEDVPNLRCVDASACVWRSGQPVSEAQWAKIHAFGVSNVVKLNLDTEGSDYPAEIAGFTVQRWPITTAQQLQFVPSYLLKGAVRAIKPGTLVHCEYGRNRTGAVVACWRMKRGWTREAAMAEADEYGFGSSFSGLVQAVKDYDPK